MLKDIYSHLCLNDVAVRGALVDSGPKPFVLHCQTQQGGFCDILYNVLIETHVDLVAGRLSCTEWLRLEKCSTLIGSGTRAWLLILERMVGIVIRFQTSRQCADLLAVLVCRFSGVIHSSSLLLMVTLFSTWTQIETL